ncbi:unnamed protein product [Caenorhabditis brenneri]
MGKGSGDDDPEIICNFDHKAAVKNDLRSTEVGKCERLNMLTSATRISKFMQKPKNCCTKRKSEGQTCCLKLYIMTALDFSRLNGNFAFEEELE